MYLIMHMTSLLDSIMALTNSLLMYREVEIMYLPKNNNNSNSSKITTSILTLINQQDSNPSNSKYNNNRLNLNLLNRVQEVLTYLICQDLHLLCHLSNQLRSRVKMLLTFLMIWTLLSQLSNLMLGFRLKFLSNNKIVMGDLMICLALEVAPRV